MHLRSCTELHNSEETFEKLMCNRKKCAFALTSTAQAIFKTI